MPFAAHQAETEVQGGMTEHAHPRAQRQRLGAELRRLRTLAGLSGREVGRRTGISHPNVSRIENGQVVPSLPQVKAWAGVVGLPPAELARLTGMTEAALTEVTTYRSRLQAGLPAMQHDVRELESTTRVLRNFSLTTVPGLLQTASYARHVLSLTPDVPADEVPEAVAARMERQSGLADPSRQFEFIVTDAALQWVPEGAAPGMLPEQLNRIAALAGLTNVSVAVVRAGVPTQVVPWCGFVLYDERDPGYEPFVIVETPHAAIYVSDPDDVDIYRRQLAALCRTALSGDGAVAFIRAMAARRP
jgi:transcriptional regulator with XRE-family HTH domain